MVVDHRIQDGHHLAHASGKRNLLVLTLSHKPVIELFHHRIVLDGREHRHVEHGSDRSSASSNASASIHFSTVAIVGR
jgi:hypothetical protein